MTRGSIRFNQMVNEQKIVENKALRRDISALMARVKQLPSSRENASAITKLQEAGMWLREDVTAQMPPCPCCKINTLVTESPAESAYRGMFFCPCNEPGANPSGHFNIA